MHQLCEAQCYRMHDCRQCEPEMAEVRKNEPKAYLRWIDPSFCCVFVGYRALGQRGRFNPSDAWMDAHYAMEKE